MSSKPPRWWVWLAAMWVVALAAVAFAVWRQVEWQKFQRDQAERQKLAAYLAPTGASIPTDSRPSKDEILAVLNATASGSDSSPERVRLLLAAMRTGESDISPAAEAALLRLGPVIAPEVAGALSDQNLRKVAVRVLAGLEPGDWITAELADQSVRPLLDLPRANTGGMEINLIPYASNVAEDKSIRYDNGLWWTVLRRFGPLAVRPLLETFEDGSCLKYTFLGFRGSGSKVVGALDAIAPGWRESEAGEKTLRALRERVAEGKGADRVNAIWTIELFGPAARDVLPTLEQLVTDPDPATSAAAAEAIKQIRKE